MERRWRVRREMAVIKGAGCGAALILALLNLDDRRALILCLVATLALAVLLARDLLVPVRLAADADGLTVVRGFAGRDRIAWPDVERVTVDVNRRYGKRWEHLEIDVGDRIYVLGGNALGASCTETAAELRSLKSAYGTPEGEQASR
ncbi:PH domain-containing protein [Streptosporangium soli]|nr:PH domain-containing protein [Streptosporangium sp. KLBMP 9127]